MRAKRCDNRRSGMRIASAVGPLGIEIVGMVGDTGFFTASIVECPGGKPMTFRSLVKIERLRSGRTAMWPGSVQRLSRSVKDVGWRRLPASRETQPANGRADRRIVSDWPRSPRHEAHEKEAPPCPVRCWRRCRIRGWCLSMRRCSARRRALRGPLSPADTPRSRYIPKASDRGYPGALGSVRAPERYFRPAPRCRPCHRLRSAPDEQP
jgi:hypothetical protein